MAYIIISPRVGVPGAEFDADGAAANGINIAALIEGGFIEQSTNETAKPAKSNNKNTPKD
jgi:hypothetical protein